MGCNCSKGAKVEIAASEETQRVTEKEDNIVLNLAESNGLKYLLSNELGYKGLSTYAKLLGTQYLLRIWELVEEYQSSSLMPQEKSLCLLNLLMDYKHLFPMAVEFSVSYAMMKTEYSPSKIQDHYDILARINLSCFANILTMIYEPFILTESYAQLSQIYKDTERWVTHTSYQYMNVIAQGGFGLVLQCRNTTNNTQYAMKIQSKAALLRSFRRDKSRVTSELEAGIVFNHPYIASVIAAFQTESLVMMVSPISTCGDLHRSLHHCPNKQMPLERVAFYSAEITSALMYMHRHNIMYRDLKPANVLLQADGHIVLADFGSVAGTS